jgi:NAD(P)-dependent dehydrogenase (short-subunit alcohol dehydrogenase family)
VSQLKGRVAVVTGGGTGIGLAIAKRFHREGASVAICGRRQTVLEQASQALEPGGDRVLAVTADVTDESQVQELLSRTVEHYGRIDVLVNNAGIMRFGTLEEATSELWDQLLQVNLLAVWRLMVKTAPIMRRGGGGSIINLSSIAGLKAFPNAGVYCTTKAALQQLSQVMAMEWAADQIRVNVICPALVEGTELADPIFGKENVQDYFQKLRPLHPLGRAGRPEDVADLALFLASPQSSWISGALIPLDGGRHMATNRPPS